MSPPLACGQCFDQSLFDYFPFSFYWVILFVAWSLAPGPLMAMVWRLNKERLPPLPHRYFLLGLGLSLVLAPVTMGAVALPMAIAAFIALVQMARSYRASRLHLASLSPMACRARRFQRLFLATYLALIPVAYLRLWWQSH